MADAHEDTLEVGDVMRWSAELFADVKTTIDATDILVKVVKIVRLDDGTVQLWLTNADDPPPGQVN